MKTKIKNVMLAAALIVSAHACTEDENDFLIPIGENNEVKIESSVYSHQTYYDLSSDKAVLTVNNSDWDLEVETGGKMKVIKLNPANAYRVFKTSSTDITEEITLPERPDWIYDDPSGEIDDLAFCDWKDNEVYVIAQKVIGDDPTRPSIEPFARISFKHQSSAITISWVIDGETAVKEASLNATNDKPFTWFSFKAEGKATVQPPSIGSYDFVVTSYTGEVKNGPVSFSMELKGVLTNSAAHTLSYRYEPGDAPDEEYIRIFNDLTKKDIEESKFEDDADEIGYEWKNFNRHEMRYEIDKSNMYFIKDGDGNYFKIRFTNYYSDVTAEKGYISFTYALL
jgi:hypothetical protein